MSQITLKDAAKKPDGLAPGHRLCAGCDESLIVRMVLKATRGPTIATSATGCLEVATSIFPYTSWNIPWIHTAFENAAANASGIEAAWKAMRRKGKGPLAGYETLDVIAFAGDGGTYDIGLQALSGALERGHEHRDPEEWWDALRGFDHYESGGESYTWKEGVEEAYR